MPIIEIIKEVRDSAAKRGNASSPRSPKEEGNYNDFVLGHIKKQIRKYEAEKYPSPPYSYQSISLPVEGSEELIATYVRYDGSPLNDKHISTMQGHALLVRKLSLIAGIFNALAFSNATDGYLGITDQKQLSQVEELLGTLLFQETNLFKEDENIKDFINRLIKEIAKITHAKEDLLITHIRTAERYFVADYRRNHILINESPTEDNKRILQVDHYFGNQLTEEQKREFIRIHGNNKPLWFTFLPAWEQTWLIKQVPQTLEQSWADFESLSQSSAMSHIPGIQNARMNYLFAVDGQNYTLLSRSFKTSTMIPYELHEPKENYPFYVKQTANQVINHLSQKATTDFNEIWGNLTFDKGIQPLVFVQSLLSDTLAAKADTRLARKQRKAIQEINLQGLYPQVRIITGNDPMNFLRYASILSGKISQTLGHWTHTDRVLNYAEQFIKCLELPKNILTPEQKARLAQINAAKEELVTLRNEPFNSQGLTRNFIAFKAAYTSILVEAMGGIVSTNCKSGKDRTGVEELYKNAMIYYFLRYNTLPKFNDQGVQRKNFVKIFVQLFNSMKAQEAAAGNTPGSFGLKLDPTMICSDIRAEIEASSKLSSTLANLNKPPKFQSDEVKSEKVRKSSISFYTRQQKRTSPLKELEKDLSDFAESHPIAKNVITFNNLRESLYEPSSQPELIQQWRDRFEDLREDIEEMQLLKKELHQLTQEVRLFVEKLNLPNKKLNTIQMKEQTDSILEILERGDQLLCETDDVLDITQQIKYDILPIAITAFEEVRASFLSNKQQAADTSPPSQSPKRPDRPPPEKPSNLDLSDKSVKELRKHYEQLSLPGNAPIIKPNLGSSPIKL